MAAVLILSTAGSREEASAIAEALVCERLAACVQLDAIESWYRWQGAVEHAPEVRLQIKTRDDLVDAVERRVRDLHSYAVPEFVVIPINGGSPDYLHWVETETTVRA